MITFNVITSFGVNCHANANIDKMSDVRCLMYVCQLINGNVCQLINGNVYRGLSDSSGPSSKTRRGRVITRPGSNLKAELPH